MNDEALECNAGRAKAQFFAMATSFALGVFNDNFFKQAALLLAVASGQAALQGWATAIFSLPFLVFAAHAGWLADRFPKRNVVISAKVLELVAMVCGAIGICMAQLNIPLILVMLGVMGLQATILSPALNGSIAELYPAGGILKANAILRIVVTAMVLVGVALAGFALDQTGKGFHGIPRGHLTVAVAVVAIGLVGVLSSLGVPRRPAAVPGLGFPWSGPVDTLRELYGLRKDSLLAITIMVDAFIWFAGSLQVLVINKMGVDQFQAGKSATSGLVVAELVGFAVGGAVSTKLAAGNRWHRVLAPGALMMGALMIQMPWVTYLPGPSRYGIAFALIALIGVGGGLILVPCESFIQMRPPMAKKGAVIAAANFAAFTGILLSGPIANLLNSRLLPTQSFSVIGVASMIVAVGVLAALRWWLTPGTDDLSAPGRRDLNP